MLAAGGLNWDSLPLKLFADGNAKFWNPADIDFSRARADWESLSELDDLPSYRRIVYEELPGSLDALLTYPSPAAQVRASATYTHVIEGMLALTGYYAWHRICVDRAILSRYAGVGPPTRTEKP